MGEVDGGTGFAARLTERYRGLEGEALLAPLIAHEFPGRIALLSSFGSEAALLLDMVARIDRAVPVIFLDTGKLFGETLRYRCDRPHVIRNRSAKPAHATMVCILKAAVME